MPGRRKVRFQLAWKRESLNTLDQLVSREAMRRAEHGITRMPSRSEMAERAIMDYAARSGL
jgi:hypothetical protein